MIMEGETKWTVRAASVVAQRVTETSHGASQGRLMVLVDGVGPGAPLTHGDLTSGVRSLSCWPSAELEHLRAETSIEACLVQAGRPRDGLCRSSCSALGHLWRLACP